MTIPITKLLTSAEVAAVTHALIAANVRNRLAESRQIADPGAIAPDPHEIEVALGHVQTLKSAGELLAAIMARRATIRVENDRARVELIQEAPCASNPPESSSSRPISSCEPTRSAPPAPAPPTTAAPPAASAADGAPAPAADAPSAPAAAPRASAASTCSTSAKRGSTPTGGSRPNLEHLEPKLGPFKLADLGFDASDLVHCPLWRIEQGKTPRIARCRRGRPYIVTAEPRPEEEPKVYSLHPVYPLAEWTEAMRPLLGEGEEATRTIEQRKAQQKKGGKGRRLKLEGVPVTAPDGQVYVFGPDTWVIEVEVS